MSWRTVQTTDRDLPALQAEILGEPTSRSSRDSNPR